MLTRKSFASLAAMTLLARASLQIDCVEAKPVKKQAAIVNQSYDRMGVAFLFSKDGSYRPSVTGFGSFDLRFRTNSKAPKTQIQMSPREKFIWNYTKVEFSNAKALSPHFLEKIVTENAFKVITDKKIPYTFFGFHKKTGKFVVVSSVDRAAAIMNAPGDYTYANLGPAGRVEIQLTKNGAFLSSDRVKTKIFIPRDSRKPIQQISPRLPQKILKGQTI